MGREPVGKAWKRVVVGVLGWSRKGIPPVATCKDDDDDDDDDDRVLSLMCDQVGFLLSLSPCLSPLPPSLYFFFCFCSCSPCWVDLASS